MDLSTLDELVEVLGPEDVAGLVEVFLEQSESQTAELEGLIAAGDHHAVSRLGHALKGSSLNMGARALAYAFASIERSEDISEASARFGALTPVLEETRLAFQAKLAELSAT